MDKNWLIRTKSNHILGPVSKEKVVELYHNGSIKPDDEICSGNGYWFFIREDDMVSRFLLGSEVQTFNPISEAKDVLTVRGHEASVGHESKEHITMVGGINFAALKQEMSSESGVPPLPDIPAVPSQKAEATVSAPKQSLSSETKKKNNVKQLPKAKAAKTAQSSLKKQDWLKYIGILGFILLFCLIYFRELIINHFFQGEITSTISLISTAHAQEEIPEKKKSF